MVRTPLVSVIIPTYNRASMVREAVASVRAQTRAADQLIVVDDGSTDETAAVLANDDTVQLVVQAHHGRPGQVRNAGAEAAVGRYLAFLDADDLWHPDKLAAQLPAALAADAVLHHTRERWLRNGRQVSQRRQRHARSGDLFATALRKCVIGPSTVLIDRQAFDAVGGFRHDLEIAEDYELWLRLTAAHTVHYLDRPLVTKRAGHNDQLSEKYGQIEIFRICALRDLVGSGYFTGQQAVAARAELARKARIYAAGCAKRGRSAEAAEYRRLAAEMS